MSKQPHTKRQSAPYDKIIKENLEVTLPEIIRDVLGLDILTSEELPDDLQHTKERRPDALKKVTDVTGKTYILHIEFQIKDEKEMVLRMAEYYIMLMRKYQLPIKQYVIYLKDEKPLMQTQIATEYLQFHFMLIKIAEAGYKLFLRSSNPEVKMLALLANFGKDDVETAIEAIVSEIKSTTKNDFAERRIFEQMRIFVQLRNNIKHQFENTMESISEFFKIENDYFYQKGEARGEAIGLAKMSKLLVENLISKSTHSNEEIAEFAAVSTDYVDHIRMQLNK